MASSRLRFVTLRAHQLSQAATAAPPKTASRPVETLAARPMATIADRFEPGASRRILGRRPSIPSATTTTVARTGPTTSTTAISPSSATSSDPTASKAASPTPRPRKTEAAPRVKAFENDPRWVAQCAAARERREQLAARHSQEAKTRWQLAVRNPDQSTKRSEAGHATCTHTRTSATTSAAISGASTSTSTSSSDSSNSNSSSSPSPNRSGGAPSGDSPAPVDGSSVQSSTTVTVASSVKDLPGSNSKWLAQRAEGRERRQQLAARHQEEEKRRWLRPNAHSAGDEYLSPSCSSALALSASNSVAATKSSSPSSADSTALEIARSHDSRWAAQTAENYERAEKIRTARRIKPIRQ